VIQALVQFLGVAVLSLVVGAVRTHRGRRRRAEVQAGGSVTCRAVLATGDQRFRTGVLLLSGARVVWQSRRGNAALELSGAHLLATGEAPQRRARPGDVLLRLMLPSRIPAQLIVQEDDAATLAELLPRTDPPPPGAPLPVLPPPGRRWWALGLVALAGVWTAVWVVLVLDGDTVRATVTGGDGDGLCTVAWVAADGPHHGTDVDCDDPPPGSTMTVWALGWPATGDVENPGWTLAGVPVVAALIATPGAVSLLRTRRARRRRRGAPANTLPPPVPPARVDVPVQDAPALSADDLRPLPQETPVETLRRLAPRAARQIPVDGWEHPGLPGGAGSPQLLTRLLRAVGAPGAILGVVVLLAWLLTGSWYVLMTATTTTAEGVSTGEVSTESHWPLPEFVTVRFATSDRVQHLADVATTESLPEGRPVTVEYALGDPGSARLVGPADGLGRTVGLTLAAAGIVLLWGCRRTRSVLAGMRAVRMAAERPPNPALGLLTADGGGRPLLIACSPFAPPLELYAVPLEAPLPHGTAALFVATVAPDLRLRGRLAEGETVVAEVGGAVLWPAGPAWLPAPEDLVTLLDSVGALGRLGDDG